MKIFALHLFNKTNSPGTITVAAWHSRHSMTWRWVLHWIPMRGETRRGWPLFYSYKTNHGRNWTIMLPWIARLDWQVQTPMWYVDLYHRERNESELDRRVESLARSMSAKPVAPSSNLLH